MAAFLTLTDTTEPLRLEYDATHYVPFAVASDGSLTVTPTGTSGAVMPWKWGQTDGIVQQFPTSEAGRAFNITLWSATNPDSGASGRDDWVMRWGYNVAKGGGRSNSADHSIAIEMENYWYQAGSGYWTEFHAAYESKNDAATRRLWSWLIDVDDDTCQMYFQSGSYEFRDFAGSGSESNYLAISSEKITAYKPILQSANNADFLYGWTTGGTSALVLKFNASNQVELGSTTNATFIPKSLQIGAAGQVGTQVSVYASTAADKASAILLNNAGSTTGTGAVIECGWGDASTKLRFGMVNGNSFVVDSYATSTWTNRLTLSNAGLLTITGGLTLAGAITQTVASANHLMTSSTGTNAAYTRYSNTGGDLYVGRNGSATGGLLTSSDAYAGIINVGGAYPLQFGTEGTLWMTLTAAGSLVLGTAAIATNATSGFLYIRASAGAPTGTPTAYTGRVPLHYDSTNHKIYVYDGGWKATAALT